MGGLLHLVQLCPWTALGDIRPPDHLKSGPPQPKKQLRLCNVVCYLLACLSVKEEQQTLSEAFTSRIGLVGGAQRGGCADEILDETMRELSEISLPGSRDVEREATLTKTKFEKFAKSFFQTKSCLAHAKLPLTEPLLAKKHEFDRTVRTLSLSPSAFISLKRNNDITIK